MKSETSTAQIKCTVDSSMHFSQSQSIHITNLEFIGCDGNKVIRVFQEFLVTDTKFEGRENSGTALELIETTAQIINSTFVSNRKGSYWEYNDIFENGFFEVGPVIDLNGTFLNATIFENGFVGGAIIATNGTTVTISQSRFEDNKAKYGGAIFADNLASST
jgi:predicted outer membrane repeat protein